MYFLWFFILLKTNSKRKSNFDVRPEINCLNKETLFFISICFMGSWVLIKHIEEEVNLVSFSAQDYIERRGIDVLPHSAKLWIKSSILDLRQKKNRRKAIVKYFLCICFRNCFWNFLFCYLLLKCFTFDFKLMKVETYLLTIETRSRYFI